MPTPLNPMEQYEADINERVNALKEKFGFDKGSQQGDMAGLVKHFNDLNWQKKRLGEDDYEFRTADVKEAIATVRVSKEAGEPLVELIGQSYTDLRPGSPEATRFVVKDKDAIKKLEALGLEENSYQQRGGGSLSR